MTNWLEIQLYGLSAAVLIVLGGVLYLFNRAEYHGYLRIGSEEAAR